MKLTRRCCDIGFSVCLAAILTSEGDAFTRQHYVMPTITALHAHQTLRFSTIENESMETSDTEEGNANDETPFPIHQPIQKPAGLLCHPKERQCREDDLTHTLPHRGQRARKRVLILCTGGTLTMSNDPAKGNSLAPVQGALTSYLESMRELTDDPEMPEVVAHEYSPLIDSSDMGPGDWALLAKDIETNYYHFDGFVVLMVSLN